MITTSSFCFPDVLRMMRGNERLLSVNSHYITDHFDVTRLHESDSLLFVFLRCSSLKRPEARQHASHGRRMREEWNHGRSNNDSINDCIASELIGVYLCLTGHQHLAFIYNFLLSRSLIHDKGLRGISESSRLLRIKSILRWKAKTENYL